MTKFWYIKWLWKRIRIGKKWPDVVLKQPNVCTFHFWYVFKQIEIPYLLIVFLSMTINKLPWRTGVQKAGRSLVSFAMMSKKVLDHCPFPALPIPYGCYCGLTLTTPTKGKVSWSKGILGGKGVSHFVSLKVFWEENEQENSNFMSISCPPFHSIWLLLTQCSLIKGKVSWSTAIWDL